MIYYVLIRLQKNKLPDQNNENDKTETKKMREAPETLLLRLQMVQVDR